LKTKAGGIRNDDGGVVFFNVNVLIASGVTVTGLQVHALDARFGTYNINFTQFTTRGSNTFSNGDLSITTCCFNSTALFSGDLRDQLQWNGTIIYEAAAAAVPEPSTFVLLGASLAGLAVRLRRRG
jgi:hypothetical protein